jgi:hypothetical protein
MCRRLKSCHNVEDMPLLAKQRLPSPIFHYIDGAADDEVTYRRNTKAFEDCDLVPNVLAGVDKVDMSVTVMGLKLDMPIFCSATALQRLFQRADLHHRRQVESEVREPEPRGPAAVGATVRAHCRGHAHADRDPPPRSTAAALRPRRREKKNSTRRFRGRCLLGSPPGS